MIVVSSLILSRRGAALLLRYCQVEIATLWDLSHLLRSARLNLKKLGLRWLQLGHLLAIPYD